MEGDLVLQAVCGVRVGPGSLNGRLVGCSVSTEFGTIRRIGAHRAPYKDPPRVSLRKLSRRTSASINEDTISVGSCAVLRNGGSPDGAGPSKKWMLHDHSYTRDRSGEPMRFWRTFVWVAAVVVAFSLRIGAADVPDGQRWWSHVLVLADDRLEGRNTGSEGHRKAAEYVAREFAKAGLEPAGTEGFLQPVRLTSREIDEAHSS